MLHPNMVTALSVAYLSDMIEASKMSLFMLHTQVNVLKALPLFCLRILHPNMATALSIAYLSGMIEAFQNESFNVTYSSER